MKSQNDDDSFSRMLRLNPQSRPNGVYVGLTGIVEAIDQEIARLTQARALLSGGSVVKRGPGRPKAITAVVKPTRKKRNLSPEGRKRIQEAVRRRWAAQRKAA